MKLRARPLLCGIGSTAVLLCVLPAGCSREKSQAEAATVPAAQVVQVQRGSISQTLKLAGQFQPYQVVEVHAKVAGYIRRINVDIGDRVHAGEVLATLEVPELNAQVQGAVAALANSRDQITRAKNAVARAESGHTAVHANYLRMRDAAASQPGIIAEQELDDARAKDLVSEAQIEEAKAALSAAQQQSGVASADKERVADMEAYTTIRAPLNGVVVWRYADTGALIQAGTSSDTQSMPIVKLSQSDLLRLRLPVPEDDVQYIHLGAPVKVHVGALNRDLTGKVVRYTRSVSLETRTMETEIDVQNADLSIDPGMYANVELQLAHKSDVLLVPDSAVERDETEASVLVVDANNRVQPRPVELGMEGSTMVEIVRGLREGDRVIDGGLSKYQANEVVDPHLETVTPGGATAESASQAAEGGK